MSYDYLNGFENENEDDEEEVEEMDELYDILTERDTKITVLNERIDALEIENEKLKKIIENLTMIKKKRGEDVSSINCNLIECVNDNLTEESLNEVLCMYSTEQHYKLLNYLLIGNKENMVPIAILSDKMITYINEKELVYIEIFEFLRFITDIIKPFVSLYVDKMISKQEEEEQDNLSECLTSVETVNSICKNSQMLLKFENVLIKRVIKNYQII